MRLLWPLLISTSKAMSGREAIAYWMAVYKGEPVPELHTDYPTQKAIERRLQAVDAHPANKPRGGDDDLEEDDDGFTKRDAYRAMWIFYWICFTAGASRADGPRHIAVLDLGATSPGLFK